MCRKARWVKPSARRYVGLIAPEQNHRRRAMAGNVCTGSVNNVCQVPLRNVCLDEFLAEFPFHEGIRRDHPHIARRRGWILFRFHRQREEHFHERRCQRISTFASDNSATCVSISRARSYRCQNFIRPMESTPSLSQIVGSAPRCVKLKMVSPWRVTG